MVYRFTMVINGNAINSSMYKAGINLYRQHNKQGVVSEIL